MLLRFWWHSPRQVAASKGERLSVNLSSGAGTRSALSAELPYFPVWCLSNILPEPGCFIYIEAVEPFLVCWTMRFFPCVCGLACCKSVISPGHLEIKVSSGWGCTFYEAFLCSDFNFLEPALYHLKIWAARVSVAALCSMALGLSDLADGGLLAKYFTRVIGYWCFAMSVSWEVAKWTSVCNIIFLQ